MCDYSLAGLPNRLAAEGENLVLHRFSTGSMGLTPSRDSSAARPAREGFRGFLRWLAAGFKRLNANHKELAVCVPPGAHLLMRQVPENLQQRWNVRSEEEVVFTQTGAIANTFRDAVRFFHGREVLLQDFPSGVPVKVLSLGDNPAGEVFDEQLATTSNSRLASV